GYASVDSRATFHTFRYDPDGTLHDLGALAPHGNEAFGINDAGQVIGDYFADEDHFPHAFRTRANSNLDPSTDDLGTLGGNWSRASGINASGQVVGGGSTTGDAAFQAFLHTDGAMQDLGSLGGPNFPDSQGFGINDDGFVVGWTFTRTGEHHAFLYD